MIETYIRRFTDSPFASLIRQTPWSITQNITAIVEDALKTPGAGDFTISNGIGIHRSAIVEQGATLKAPVLIGPGCFIATGAYLRGGVWLDRDCIIGPGAELKSSLMFSGSKLAHFNFVGDSILGAGVNLEAGSIVANYRNERKDKIIRYRHANGLLSTGVDKFGALIGDDVRVGANAVIAPGALVPPGTVIRRLSLLDQDIEQGNL